MDKTAKIYIAGHTGLAGNAIKKELEKQGYFNLICKTHEELDLTDKLATDSFFATTKPEYVIIAAAKVGGILANSKYPVEFMLENLKIQTNIIEASYKNNVKKLIFLGSSCIYPKNAPQPLKEEYLLTSELEKTNESYALAKICGVKLCEYFNKQYNCNFLSVMPCNLYGENDTYHEENAHVIPMLIEKIHNAKIENKNKVEIWGTGEPLREFLFASDLAKAIILTLINDTQHLGPLINIGTNTEISIKNLAETIKKIIGFTGEIVYDNSKPDGTKRKLLDSSKINLLGWQAKISLEEGIRLAYNDFLMRKHK